MHLLSPSLLSLSLLALPHLVHSQTSTPSQQDDAEVDASIQLSYNDAYQPEILDLLTQGVLKYGLFKSELKTYSKLNNRVSSTVKGLNLDLGVGLLGDTVKIDLGLGLFKKKSKTKQKSRLARHDEPANLAKKSHSSSPTKEKRLLSIDLGLGALFGVGGGSNEGGTSSSNSLISVDLGIQTIVDDPWNDAVTTRLMNSQNDNAWFANISFGTPRQTLTMFIDSGSADTTVFDPTCTTCGLATRKPFIHTSSSTFTTTNVAFSTSYGDGTSMNGFLGKDIVQVSSSLSTPSNQLLAVIKSQIKGSGARLYDGILGIGPDPLSFVQDNVTPFSNLVKANKLTRPLVGIALVKKNKLTNAPGGGEFRWGSVNNNYISGSILYTPVTSAYYWGIDIPGVYMNNMQLYGPGESKRAILDTGTTLVYVSTPLAATIHSKIPGSSFNTQEGAWYVPCDVSNLPRPGNLLGDPNVFFEIGGRKWGIPIQDVAFRTSGRSDGLCVSGIQGGSNQFMVLGDVFIKNHYLVLSYGNAQQSALQIGLANRSDLPPIL